jgi:hypothetical protein
LADGSILAVGTFCGEATTVCDPSGTPGCTAVFGAGEANQTTLTSTGRQDFFIAKYNADGTLAWAKSTGGQGCDIATGVAVYAGGGFYVSGYYYGGARFGETPNDVLVTSARWTKTYYAEGFLAKYTSDGTLSWVRSLESEGDDRVLSVAVRPSDAAAVVTGHMGRGWNYPTIDCVLYVDGTPVLTRPPFNNGAANVMFAVELASSGTTQWATQGYTSSPSASNEGLAIDVLGDGATLVVGRMGGSALTFGVGEVNETTLSGGTLFLAKYAPAGTLTWVRQIGGSTFGGDFLATVAAPAGSGFFVSSNFQATITVGQNAGGEVVLSPTDLGNYGDFFVARFSDTTP